MSVCPHVRLSPSLPVRVLAHLSVEYHHDGDDPAQAHLLHGCHEQDVGVPRHTRQP